MADRNEDDKEEKWPEELDDELNLNGDGTDATCQSFIHKIV